MSRLSARLHDLIGAAPSGLTLNELSATLGDECKKSTVSATLYNLKKRREIVHDWRTGKYRVPDDDFAKAPEGEPAAYCDDCGRRYGDEYGFPDLVIPNDAWRRISPTGDDCGLLCPSCICSRLAKAGIRCFGSFMSGPIESVSQPLMHTMRWMENLREQGHGWSCPSCGECRERDTTEK